MFLGTSAFSETFPIPELTEHPEPEDTGSRGPFHVPHGICTGDLLASGRVPWGRKGKGGAELRELPT